MKKQLKYTLFILTGMLTLSAPNLKAADKNIVDTAMAAGDFKILSKALEITGLNEGLKGKGSFTVFAPTDEAFMRLPKGTLQTLLKPENKDQLTKVLRYHVIPGSVDGATAVTLKDAKTLNGEKVTVQFKNAALYINQSRVTATDIVATNGVIHVVDNVLIPKDISPKKSVKINVTGKNAVSEKILMDAIGVGVDLFNAGNEKACESVYKIAVMAVLEIKPKAIDKDLFTKITKTLTKVESEDNIRANAWSLRRAIDAMLVKLVK